MAMTRSKVNKAKSPSKSSKKRSKSSINTPRSSSGPSNSKSAGESSRQVPPVVLGLTAPKDTSHLEGKLISCEPSLEATSNSSKTLTESDIPSKEGVVSLTTSSIGGGEEEASINDVLCSLDSEDDEDMDEDEDGEGDNTCIERLEKMVEQICGHEIAGNIPSKPNAPISIDPKPVSPIPSLHRDHAKNDRSDNQKSFASLFPNNRSINNGMELHQLEVGDLVVMEDEDLCDVEKEWGFCLVGCFAGRFPGLKSVHAMVAKWKVKCEVLPHARGWVVFKFLSEEDRAKVINGGHYSANGHYLMIKKLERGFEFDMKEFLIVPVWIKLPMISCDYWTSRGLSKLGSRVGRVISTDAITANKQRLGFARLLVEIDLSKELVYEYKVRKVDGKVYTQLVEYEDLPFYCRSCKEFDHYTEGCSSMQGCSVDGADCTKEVVNDAVEFVPKSSHVPRPSQNVFDRLAAPKRNQGPAQTRTTYQNRPVHNHGIVKKPLQDTAMSRLGTQPIVFAQSSKQVMGRHGGNSHEAGPSKFANDGWLPGGRNMRRRFEYQAKQQRPLEIGKDDMPKELESIEEIEQCLGEGLNPLVHK